MPPKRRASGLLSQTLLNELREREAKDELKKHVVKYGLWKREDDPKTTPLSLHELQSLAKYWKLHHRVCKLKANIIFLKKKKKKLGGGSSLLFI